MTLTWLVTTAQVDRASNVLRLHRISRKFCWVGTIQYRPKKLSTVSVKRRYLALLIRLVLVLVLLLFLAGVVLNGLYYKYLGQNAAIRLQNSEILVTLYNQYDFLKAELSTLKWVVARFAN
jgi:hypothetical protein